MPFINFQLNAKKTQSYQAKNYNVFVNEEASRLQG